MKYYAHTLEGEPPEKWQSLEEHLRNVAEMAGEFARPFGGDQWASLAGLWHDLGKYSNAFQAKLYVENGFENHLETKPGKVVHSEAGGHQASLQGWKGVDRVFSWLIMGHHAGLTDFHSDHVGLKALEPKMHEPENSVDIIKNAPPSILSQPNPQQQSFPSGADPALFIRMLFSCIVDADFLDTEAFMNKGKAARRDGHDLYPSVEEKAAHLLYFVIKDHPFTDGNKRIGSFLFVLFLHSNGLLEPEKCFDNRALVSLALLTAASDPGQKELMIRLIMYLMSEEE